MDSRTRPGLLRRLGSLREVVSRKRGGGTGEEPRSEQSEGLEAAPAPSDPRAERPEIESTTSERTDALSPTERTEPNADDGDVSAARKVGAQPRPTRAGPAVADPAPLGLAALALTTLVLSLFESGLLSEAGEPVVLGLALAYGGLAQLLAGMWAFRGPNTFAATAFVSYGAFWLSYFLLEAFFADEVPAADLGAYVGWTLIAWALFTTYMYVASFKLTGRVNVVFLLLGATLYLLGIGEVIGVEIVTRVGGFVGLLTAAAAGYASFATITDEAARQKVLPVREPG